MGVPTFVGAGALAAAAADLTVVPNASHASGDYELMPVETQDQIIALLTANGFTEHPGSPILASSGTATIATRLTVFERIWNGSDGSPVLDFTSQNHIIAAILSFRRSTGTWSALSDVRSAVQGTGWQKESELTEDTTGSWPGLTTDTADQLIIGLTAHAKPDVAGGTAEMSNIVNSNLATITERFDDAANTGNGGWLGAFTGEEATSGQAIGATTYDKASASFKAHLTIGIRDSAPATAITFAASIAGLGAVTVDFVRQQTLAVGIAGLGALTTQLDMTRALEVAITGLGAVTADFVRDKLVFEVGVAGLGALAADITVERTVVLEASIAGSSTVTTDFVRQVGLAALLSGQGALATELVRQLGFETAIAGLATVVPSQLAVQVGMETIVQGVGQVIADFIRTPLAMEAAIAGNGVIAVDITVTTPGGEVLIVRTLLGVGL